MPKSMKLLPSLRLLCVAPIAVAGGLIVSGPATADPQELKVTEHATTDAVTDIGASGDSAGQVTEAPGFGLHHATNARPCV